jgi:hypothetical protein
LGASRYRPSSSSLPNRARGPRRGPPPWATVRHRHPPPARERFDGEEQARRAIPRVNAVEPLHRPRGRGRALARRADELGESLVRAYDRALRGVRAAMDREHVSHVVDERSRPLRRGTPPLPQVRLDLVVWRVRRTVSWESVATGASAAMRSASGRSVRRALPRADRRRPAPANGPRALRPACVRGPASRAWAAVPRAARARRTVAAPARWGGRSPPGPSRSPPPHAPARLPPRRPGGGFGRGPARGRRP